MLESLLTYEWQCYDDELHVDSFGDSCQWYYENPEGCGAYDTADFEAAELCCACYDETGMTGGYYASCEDEDANGTLVDTGLDGCEWYNVNVDSCGHYDTDTFKANDACCACWGGDWELGCVDWDGVDSFGDSCSWYEGNRKNAVCTILPISSPLILA